ncbi:MAG: thiosulfate sulfurtransferase GlpE [Pseudomonas sp.]|nr:thiosulfate sulfurtransferase GlpE [Pseudomonas sp.]MBQ0777039.1 thiosulfate sulfurtransferase GlpE [Pseudomonas sp.]
MSEFQRISPEQASQLLEQGAALVDIRDPQSYAQGHISDAVRLDNDSLPAYVATADKRAPLIVCCYHGNSSQPAAAYLASLGFEQVYSLDGGFELWRAQYPGNISSS